MKGRILLLLCVIAACVAALSSCLVVPGVDNGDKKKEGFSAIVTPEENPGLDYIALRAAYYDETGVMLDLLSAADGDPDGNAIYIGETGSALTAAAKSAFGATLQSAGKTSGDEIGFIFYSDGASAALWWSDGFVLEDAYSYLLESVMRVGLQKLDSGIVHIHHFSKQAARLEEEQALRDADFAEAEAIIGKEATEALLAHYSIYGEEVYLWLASLYDPGVGGFYYSQSALENQGFLPDLESTYQALGLLGNIGIFYDFGGSYAKGLPTWMKNQIVKFVKGLQSSEDGYFYHPQWGSSILTSRRARDLNWATSLLTAFGEKPKWNTPNGKVGEFGTPPDAVAKRVGLGFESVAVAVSKVVAVASSAVYPAHLETLDAWRNYLVCELNGGSDINDTAPNLIRKNSYSIGNVLTAQADQIIARDKAALDSGEMTDVDKNGYCDGGYVETLIELLDSWQLSYNGLWEHSLSMRDGTVVEDEEGEPYYTSVNGLMKISAVYLEMGIEFPNPEAALRQAIFMINHYESGSDGKPGADLNGYRPSNVVDVYNPWITVHQLLTNVEKFGDWQMAESVRTELVANAEEMIRTTTAKTLLFKRADGSFSYDWDGDMYMSQGASVAVKGSCEGNVNGCTLAVSGVTRNICYALGLKNIPMFYGTDYDKFMAEIESMSPVIKDPIVESEPEPIGFEDYEPGVTNSEIDILSTNLGTGYVEIAEAPAYGSDSYGNALKLVAQSKGASDAMYFDVSGRGPGCFILEFDIYFDTYNEDITLFQATLGGTYRLTFTAIDGYIYLKDSNNLSASPITNDLGVAFAAREWHKVRVEYYPGTAQTVATKIYLDGALRAVSDNYLGRDDSLATPAEPKTNYTQVTFNSLSDAVQTLYLDNVLACRTEDRYEEEPVQTPYLVKDFENERDSLFAADVGEAVIAADPDGADNKALYFGGATTAVLPSSITSFDYNCYSLTTRIYAEGGDDGELCRIYLDDRNISHAVVAWSLVLYTEGRSQYLAIYELTHDRNGESVGAEPVADGIATDEWVTLRLEYYIRQYDADYTYCRSTVYEMDGEAEQVIGRGESYYNINNMKRDFAVVRIVSCETGGLWLDDLTPAKIRRDYVGKDGAVEPDTAVPFPSAGAASNTPADRNHSGYFDFEGEAIGVPAVPGLSTNPNKDQVGNSIEIAKDPLDDDNTALKVQTKPASAGDTVKFTWSYIQTSGSLLVAEYSMYISSIGDSAVLQASIRGEGGLPVSTVLSLNTNITANGDGSYKLVVSALTAQGSGGNVLTADSVSGWFTFRIVYDTATHSTTVSVGDGAVGQTGAYWSEDNRDSAPHYLYIFATASTEICYYIDNVSVKNASDMSE